MKNYDGLSLIHSNTESKIYSAQSKLDHQAYILKFLRRNPASQDKLQSELELHQKLSHEHLVHLKTSFSHLENGINYFVMVLEYCSGGSLDLMLPSEVDLVGRLSWLLDAARGVQYLHEKKIIHRDIKPENVLLSRGRAKIADLGIAKHLRDVDSVDQYHLGTFWYSAPELFAEEYYGCQADVWSFGILSLEIIMNCRINTLVQGQAPPAQRPNFPSQELLQYIPEPKLRSLVKKMLLRKKDKRPTMTTIVEKLEKRLANLRKICGIEQVQIQLPLQDTEIDHSEPKREWLRRIQPSKEKVKPEKYKLKTSHGTDVIVKYDDYRQQLRVTYQKMEITYEYKALPALLKSYFKNLGELNLALKQSNSKLSFSTNGALVLPYKSRLPFDPNNLSRLISDRSSITILSSQDEPQVERDPNLFKKYEDNSKIILEQDENSSLGEKLSGKSGSKSNSKNDRSSKRSYHFGQKVRESKENGEGDSAIEPEIKEEPVEHEEIVEVKPEIVTPIPPEPGSVSPSAPGPKVEVVEAPLQPPPPVVIPPVAQQVEEEIRQPQEHAEQQPIEEPNTFNSQQQAYSQHAHIPQQEQNHYFRPPPPTSPVNPSQISDLQAQISILQQVQGPQRILLPDQYMRLSHLYFQNKDHLKSAQNLEKAIEHYTNNHLYYSDKCAKAHYYLSKLYFFEINDDDILKSLIEMFEHKQAQQERPFTPQEEKVLNKLETTINILSALGSYDFITESKTYNFIGQLYLKANNLFFAEESFLNALRIARDPTGKKQKSLLYKPTINLGKVYQKWGNYGQAYPYYIQALDLLNAKTTILQELILRNGLQQCCIFLQDFDEGLTHFQRMLVLWKTMKVEIKSIQDEFFKICRRWIRLGMDSFRQDIRKHLIRLRKFIDQYFPGKQETIVTLESCIDSSPQLR